ncbi:LytTR family DNA-binding domain-containing protein [Paragemmobacter straminiformis]|uniref:LytTR family transcriptional regulator n=1 Tax=Paragemmobacter straminiformis TaxID=2045119 RepID=A0A842I4F6_9RHOB|nr:LytTR family DNA-binding domain-containing protein [Gemmobacter straminiformis]MBC2834536.1 LytTR family transcriptional regulator [Gemmobacter straminiformis]
MSRKPQTRTSGEGLHVRLINGDTLRLRRFEVGRLLMHRYLMAVYLGVVILLTLADPSGQAVSTPLRLRSLVYVIGLTSTILCLGLTCLAIELWRGGKGKPVQVHGSPIMLFTAAVALGASQIAAVAVVPTHVVQIKVFLILVVFYYVMTEVFIQLVAWLLMDRILAELRDRPEGAVIGDTPRAANDMLDAGVRDFPMAEILHLEARGNYVAIHTDSGVTEVPGPFSALIEQMPDTIGLRIHRSHWVARRAIVRSRKQGRDLLVDLVHGGTAPVALPRQREVMDWLVASEVAA